MVDAVQLLKKENVLLTKFKCFAFFEYLNNQNLALTAKQTSLCSLHRILCMDMQHHRHP